RPEEAYRREPLRRGVPAARDDAREPGRRDARRRPGRARLRPRESPRDEPAARGAETHRRDPDQRRAKRIQTRGGGVSLVSNPKCFMSDLEGTLILSDRKLGGYPAMRGAADTLAALDERGIPWIAMPDGSAYPASVQAPRLRAVALPIRDDRLS